MRLSYDGVDIRKLSARTRGTSYCYAYLALDECRHRPFIIYQPEENLEILNRYLMTRFIVHHHRQGKTPSDNGPLTTATW